MTSRVWAVVAGPPRRRTLCSLLMLMFCSSFVAGQSVSASRSAPFVANQGQWPPYARFVARTGGQQVRAERGAIVWQRWGSGSDGRPREGVVRLEFEGARWDAVIRGGSRLEGECHFLDGSDRSAWRRHVPRFESIVYEGLYDGIDLHLRAGTAGLDVELELEPGARIDDVIVQCLGVSALGPDANGGLRFQAPVGEICVSAPIDGTLGPVTDLSGGTHLRAIGANRFGLQNDQRFSSVPLTIRAGLEWATYLGGSMGENYSARQSVALGPGSQVTVAGSTESPDFPTTPGAHDVTFDGEDGFVTRLESGGKALVFSTFLKGATISALGVDATGTTTVAGSAGPGLPTTSGAFDRTMNGTPDGFVARLTPDGGDLVFSTYLGGSLLDIINAALVKVDGSILVIGETDSFDFPVTQGAFDTVHEGSGFNEREGFVARLTVDGGALAFSTYLGGSEIDRPLALALLGDDRPVVGGISKSPDFPFTSGTYSSNPDDMFVAVLSADGSQLESATSLGGTHNNEGITGVAVSPVGDVVVAGFTLSSDFPTTPDAYQPSDLGGLGTHGFVSIFDPALSSLKHSTYLWGGASAGINTLLVDPLGAPIVGGVSWGAFFPTTPGAYKEALPFGDINDVFVSRFSPDLSELWYSTFVGGSGKEDLGPGNPGLALDVDGAVVAAFATTSTDFPTGPDPFQPSFGGATDALIARLSLLPAGVTKHGSSTPGGHGPLAAGVTAMPALGSTDFALTCGHAPPSSVGWLAVGLGALQAPVFAGGAELWVDPGTLIGLLLVPSDSIGACIQPLRLPENPAAVGLQAFVQFFWKDPGASAGPLSASNALSITIQP